MADSPALDLRWHAGPDANDLADILYAALDDFSPVAIHEHESAGGWRVFFRTREQRAGAAAYLTTAFGDVLAEIVPVDVADEEWARRSQANLTAIRVGRLVVAPPWDETRDDDAVRIVIDPSTGFGTGHHETTRLCLSLLQEIDLAGRRAIDVGTGSGVLAIAAAKLGASPVLAIDEDPDALRNAEDNVALNAVANAVALRVADLASFASEPAPVVTANLTAGVLERHAARLRALVAPGGALIVSGFSAVEADHVAGAFDVRVERRAVEGEWVALLLRAIRPD